MPNGFMFQMGRINICTSSLFSLYTQRVRAGKHKSG